MSTNRNRKVVTKLETIAATTHLDAPKKLGFSIFPALSAANFCSVFGESGKR